MSKKKKTFYYDVKKVHLNKNKSKRFEKHFFSKYLKMLINVYSDFVALGKCVLSSTSRSLKVYQNVDFWSHFENSNDHNHEPVT